METYSNDECTVLIGYAEEIRSEFNRRIADGAGMYLHHR